MHSIHKRLVTWLLVGLLAVSTIASLLIYPQMLEEINEIQDFELRQVSYAIADSSGNLMPTSPSPQPSTEEERPIFTTQIWRNHKQLYYASNPQHILPLSTREGLSTMQDGDSAWRLFRFTTADRMIQVAQSMQDRQETAMESVFRMLLPFLALVVMLILGEYIAVHQGLKPLRQLTHDIKQRDSQSMQPFLVSHLPHELQPLMVALNDLLHRLNLAMQAQRQFIGDAAHELRTPLTALALQVNLLQHAEAVDARHEATLQLKQGIARASHLIQQLLDLAHQEHADVLILSPINLAEEVKASAGMLSPLAAHKAIELSVSLPPAAWMQGNRDSLQLLINNVLDNAIRYTPEGGSIEMSLCSEAKWLHFNISDTGKGIAESERERIFERFYRPAGQSVMGSGLGLAIVQQVASLHHAVVKVHQPASGQGTLFTVSFPIDG